MYRSPQEAPALIETHFEALPERVRQKLVAELRNHSGGAFASATSREEAPLRGSFLIVLGVVLIPLAFWFVWANVSDYVAAMSSFNPEAAHGRLYSRLLMTSVFFGFGVYAFAHGMLRRRLHQWRVREGIVGRVYLYKNSLAHVNPHGDVRIYDIQNLPPLSERLVVKIRQGNSTRSTFLGWSVTFFLPEESGVPEPRRLTPVFLISAEDDEKLFLERFESHRSDPDADELLSEADLLQLRKPSAAKRKIRSPFFRALAIGAAAALLAWCLCYLGMALTT